MKIEQGDVYWYQLPSDEKAIAHPHVVLQDTVLNQSVIDSLVVCGITTNMKKVSWPGNVVLDMNEANLSKKSIVDVSQVRVIKKSELGAFIGKLSSQRILQIFSGLKLIQALQD